MAEAERTTASRELILRAAQRIFCARGDGPLGVSELALAAGVARGTIYNQFGDASGLFEQVATALAVDLRQALENLSREPDEPPHRLARGLIFCLRRADCDRDWGRFIARFGWSAAALREVWRGAAREDLLRGAASGCYDFPDDQLEAAIGLASGATIMAIGAVAAGDSEWRAAGSALAERVLRALGVARAPAAAFAARGLAEVEAYWPL